MIAHATASARVNGFVRVVVRRLHRNATNCNRRHVVQRRGGIVARTKRFGSESRLVPTFDSRLNRSQGRGLARILGAFPGRWPEGEPGQAGASPRCTGVAEGHTGVAEGRGRGAPRGSGKSGPERWLRQICRNWPLPRTPRPVFGESVRVRGLWYEHRHNLAVVMGQWRWDRHIALDERNNNARLFPRSGFANPRRRFPKPPVAC